MSNFPYFAKQNITFVFYILTSFSMQKNKKKDFSESILNNGFIRGLDGLLLILCGTLEFCSESEFYLKLKLIIPCVIVSAILVTFNYDRVQKNVEFFEWDYTERKKRESFLISYLFINGFFSILVTFCAAMSFTFIYYVHNYTIFAISLLPLVLILFNMIFTVSIWYNAFEKDLTLSYKIQKKPDNWQESGREIKPSDEYDEIMRRDFRI